MTPGRAVPIVTLRKAAQFRTWRTWWSPCLQRDHRHKCIYIHVKMKIQICEICMSSHFSWRLIILSVSALAGVVCRRGYSSLLLFHCSWSSSQWTEGSKPTHLSLFLQQFLWSSQVKALKQICTVKKNKCWIKFFFFGGVSSHHNIVRASDHVWPIFSLEMLRNNFTNILQTQNAILNPWLFKLKTIIFCYFFKSITTYR